MTCVGQCGTSAQLVDVFQYLLVVHGKPGANMRFQVYTAETSGLAPKFQKVTCQGQYGHGLALVWRAFFMDAFLIFPASTENGHKCHELDMVLTWPGG